MATVSHLTHCYAGLNDSNAKDAQESSSDNPLYTLAEGTCHRRIEREHSLIPQSRTAMCRSWLRPGGAFGVWQRRLGRLK